MICATVLFNYANDSIRLLPLQDVMPGSLTANINSYNVLIYQSWCEIYVN